RAVPREPSEHVETPQDATPCSSALRDVLRNALSTLGFRTAEADRALAALDPGGWERPLEVLLREAPGVLAEGPPACAGLGPKGAWPAISWPSCSPAVPTSRLSTPIALSLAPSKSRA